MTKNSIRYPAEWEKQSATWLAFPHNKTNWYGERGINIRKFYVELICNITEFQPVNLLLPSKSFLTDEEKAALANRPFPVNFIVIKTNDIWIRDYGPFFMKLGDKKVITETQFNAWGAKFPPWGLDNDIPQKIAAKTGLPLIESVPYIFEGGAIEVNGDGLGITTEDCLVGKNRNDVKHLNKVSKALRKAFGLKDLLVLPHGLHGDHTDGHIDNVARFVAKDRIVMCMADNKRSPNAPILSEAQGASGREYGYGLRAHAAVRSAAEALRHLQGAGLRNSRFSVQPVFGTGQGERRRNSPVLHAHLPHNLPALQED